VRKTYQEPIADIRKYSVEVSEYITTSDIENNKDNGLFNDDKYDYFG
jgi:hypothetical protein